MRYLFPFLFRVVRSNITPVSPATKLPMRYPAQGTLTTATPDVLRKGATTHTLLSFVPPPRISLSMSLSFRYDLCAGKPNLGSGYWLPIHLLTGWVGARHFIIASGVPFLIVRTRKSNVSRWGSLGTCCSSFSRYSDRHSPGKKQNVDDTFLECFVASWLKMSL